MVRLGQRTALCVETDLKDQIYFAFRLLIAKYQRRFPGFDGKIVPIYASGISIREIQGHLCEPHGIEVSLDLARA